MPGLGSKLSPQRFLARACAALRTVTNFNHYVDMTYIPIVLPLMAKSTQDRYKGVIENYLRPAFGKLCLRDLTTLTIQRYFSEMATSPFAHESRDKIRDVLSSVLARPFSMAYW